MNYFIIENNKQQGPFSLQELNDKNLTPDRLVWTEGMADWNPAGDVEELKSILRPSPLTPPDIPGQKKDSCLKRLLIVFAGLLVAMLVAMAVSCPDKQAHKNAISEKVMLGIQKSAKNNGGMFGAGLQFVHNILNERMFDTMLNAMLDYESYIIFSKGSVNFDGKSHTISYGVFGKVFTLNEDDVAKYIDQNKPFANVNSPENTGQTAQKQPKDGKTATSDPLGDIQTELVGAMGRIVKKQMTENADSTSSEALGQIIDGVTDLIIGGIQKAQ